MNNDIYKIYFSDETKDQLTSFDDQAANAHLYLTTLQWIIKIQFGKWLKYKVEKKQDKSIISIFKDIEKNSKKQQEIVATIIWATVQQIAKYSTISKSGYFSIHLYDVDTKTFIKELKKFLDKYSTPTIKQSTKTYIDPQKLNHFRDNDYAKALTLMSMFKYFLNQYLFPKS